MSLIQQMSGMWWEWVVPMSAQLAVLGLMVAAMDRALRGRLWPRQRSVLWWLVLLKVLVTPTMVSPVSIARLAPEVHVAAPSQVSSAPALVPTLFAVWLLVAIGLTGFGIRRFRARLRGWHQGAVPAEPSILRLVETCAQTVGVKQPRVVISFEIRSPAVVGVLRPTLLMPADFSRHNPDHVVSEILAHELMHIRHRDPLASWVAVAIQTVLWFHPVVWLANARLMALREEACDLGAAQLLYGTSSYHDTLVGFAARHTLDDEPLGALWFFRSRISLRDRLRALEGFQSSRAASRRVAAALLALTLLVAVVPLATAPPPPRLPNYSHLAPQGCFKTRTQALILLALQKSDTP